MKLKWNKKYFPKFIIVEGRNPYNGVNIILNKYHIICDPYLGIRRCLIIIIPCPCIYIINAMNLPWDTSLVPKDHTIYSSVKNENIIQYWVNIMIG